MGKNEGGGMKDKWNMMINNHESIDAGVHLNVSDPKWKLSHDTQWMAEGKTEKLMKNVAISDCFPFYFMSSYTNFYGVMAVSINIFQPYTQGNFHSLKEGVMMTYIRYVHTRWTNDLNASLILFVSLLMKLITDPCAP